MTIVYEILNEQEPPLSPIWVEIKNSHETQQICKVGCHESC
uniref:Uncharacterized protein n=1 Tax=Rhizophora mucronata TaxID=61149 RepID=A0A2P2JYS0_RHIMU